MLRFENFRYELCLYIFCRKRNFRRLTLYASDIPAARTSGTELLRMKTELGSHFRTEDLGTARKFIGVQFTFDRTKQFFFLSQSFVVDKISGRLQVTQAMLVSPPMEALRFNSPLSNLEPFSDNRTYHSSTGSLMYFMLCTRFDIASALENVF